MQQASRAQASTPRRARTAYVTEEADHQGQTFWDLLEQRASSQTLLDTRKLRPGAYDRTACHATDAFGEKPTKHFSTLKGGRRSF